MELVEESINWFGTKLMTEYTWLNWRTYYFSTKTYAMEIEGKTQKRRLGGAMSGNSYQQKFSMARKD